MKHRNHLLLALALLASPWSLYAHAPGLSAATVRLGPNRLEASLGFSTADIAEVVELDRNHDGNVTADEMAEAAVELKEAAPGALEVRFNDQQVQATNAACAFDDQQNVTVDLSLPAQPFTNLVIRSKWLALLPPGHRQFVSLQNLNNEVLAERLLSANSDSISIQMDAPPAAPSAPQPKPVVAGPSNSFSGFLKLGVIHIWAGYDHLLFLFGLLIVTRTFKTSITIISCFTLAHSLTLAIATLGTFQVPSHIVEPLIAASIVYVGIENLFRGDDPKGRWLLTFCFGLIHGFGFASVLREHGVGAHGSGIAVPLLSFNLGVELGQIAIAAVVLPLLWLLRGKEKTLRIERWVPACSVLIALLGGYWLIERIWTFSRS